MDNNSDLFVDYILEARLLRLLAPNAVLPYDVLKLRLADCADGRAVRRVLARLIDRGLVTRRANRQAVWYIGYTRQPIAD